MKRYLWLVVFTLVAFAVSATGQKEAKFPNQPVTIIVPWAPGGLKNVLFDMMKPILSKELGVPVVVESKPGGGGAVGWKELQVAKPDGYTVAAASNSIYGVTHTTKGAVNYQNFVPVVSLTESYFAITVNADSQWKTLAEFYQYAKDNPGKVRVGNSGTGGIWEIAALLFEQEAGVQLLPVPFSGGAQAVTALMGNHIEAVSVTPDDMTATLPSGKLKILAIGSPQRDPYYPDIPTIDQAIGKNVVVGNWSGVIAPKGTPADRIKVLANAFQKAAQDPQYIAFMKKNRLISDFQGTGAFTKTYSDDAQKIMQVLQSLSG